MQASRFEVEDARRNEGAEAPRPEDPPRMAARAPDRGDEDDPRRNETPEEPGYGHGV